MDAALWAIHATPARTKFTGTRACGAAGAMYVKGARKHAMPQDKRTLLAGATTMPGLGLRLAVDVIRQRMAVNVPLHRALGPYVGARGRAVCCAAMATDPLSLGIAHRVLDLHVQPYTCTY